MKKLTYSFILLFSLSTILSSCRNEKTAGEKIEDGIEEVGDGIEDAAYDAGNTLEGVTDDIGDAAK